jgi:two-component system cell cycle sensor histidine kinase/response regulator CckA
MKDYRISELLDLSTIQKLAEGHYQATGMPIGIIDASDGSVLVATGWQDICTLFHRAHPSSLRYCQESDNYIKSHLTEGEVCHYRCKNGLWDIGVPIMVAKRHLATIFLGQFFYEGETADRDYFIRQAQQYGYNLSEYLAALDRVPIFTKEKVDSIIAYNKYFSRFMAELAERSLSNFKAEQALRDSEYKFRVLTETSPAAIFLYHKEKIIYANPGTARMLGFAEEEFREIRLWDWIPSELKDKVQSQGLTRQWGESVSSPFECKFTTISGEEIWGYVSTGQMEYQGSPAVIVVIHDITKKREAEEGLRKSTERYHAIVHAFDGLIYICSDDYRIEFMNDRLLNRTGKNAVGEFCFKALHDRDSVCPWCVNERVFAGETVRWELQSPKDGRWYYVVNAPIRNANGSMSKQSMITDITERKRMVEELSLAHEELEKRVIERTEQLQKTAEELRTSEERYALAVQGSNDGIWDRDFLTGEVYYSPRWKSMLGCEDDELPNNSEEWKKRIYPDDYQMVMDALVGYMEGRNPSYEVEYRLQHKDSSYRYILARGICLRDHHGVPYRFSGSHTDITDKKRAEDALMQSEIHFRQAVEHSPVAIAIYSNMEEKFILVNRKFTEQFGYTLEDIPDVGHWWSLAYPDEKYRKAVKAEWASKVKQAIKNKSPFEPMEAVVTCKDGSIRHIEFNFSSVGERNLVSLIDHTEIKSAQEVVKKSEEKYRRLFEKSKDAIFISNPGRRFIDINQAGIELFGYTKEELFSLDLEKLYWNPEDREVLWQKLHRSGFVSDFEVEMKRKDGEKIIVHISFSVITDDSGEVSGYQGIIRDVTERKRLERQLLQSQKMESVGILAGGVAHDFNNLLTAISGYGQILQETIPKDDEPSQESIRNVLNAADRAAELTRGLLAFSRKQLISPKPVHIHTLISDTGKLIQRIIGEDIEFSTNFASKNLLVKADPGQIEQILMNLATNARDAMPHGGHLSITTRHMVVEDGSETLYDLQSPGNYALISVSDTGTGMDKKTLESIFEPFFTTKEVGKGTGLGLSIVHGILKQHNGSVLASSKPGKGTTFDIYLPLVKGHTVKEESKVSTPHVGGMETLLVAEDEEIVRAFMKKVLERAGYRVIIANDGEDAVARFRDQDDISLVLSDLVMPRKNGKEMLDEIKKIKPGIKAVFISGYATDIMQKKGIFGEGAEYITKPFKKDDLLQKVREVLDKD